MAKKAAGPALITKCTDPDDTTAETLMRAAEIGRKSGLRYIYAGNMPGEVEDFENTRCPNCQQLLIERYGYLITGYFLTREGSCRNCGTAPGRWAPEFQGQITAYPCVPHRSMGSRLVSILSSPASQRLTFFHQSRNSCSTKE